MYIIERIEKYIDRQYHQPDGLIGYLVGRRMAQKHLPENLWTVSLLHARPTDRVLEVGFGPGIAIKHLSEQITGGRIVGIDISSTMLHSAQRRNAQAIKAGQVALRQGDCMQLPCRQNSFDKVFSVHTLYFWPNPQHVLSEMKRVLKPGGQLYLTFLSKDCWSDRASGSDDGRHYSADAVIKMLIEAGFSNLRVDRGSDPKGFKEICITGMKERSFTMPGARSRYSNAIAV